MWLGGRCSRCAGDGGAALTCPRKHWTHLLLLPPHTHHCEAMMAGRNGPTERRSTCRAPAAGLHHIHVAADAEPAAVAPPHQRRVAPAAGLAPNVAAASWCKSFPCSSFCTRLACSRQCCCDTVLACQTGTAGTTHKKSIAALVRGEHSALHGAVGVQQRPALQHLLPQGRRDAVAVRPAPGGLCTSRHTWLLWLQSRVCRSRLPTHATWPDRIQQDCNMQLMLEAAA